MDKRPSRGKRGRGRGSEEEVEPPKSTKKPFREKVPGEKKEIIVCEKPLIIKCKNQEQINFIKVVDENEIIFCNGPAGCGKSYMSIMKAINYLREDNPYKKIVLITPAVESTTKSLGFLPGTQEDKISVYMNSIYRLFKEKVQIIM